MKKYNQKYYLLELNKDVFFFCFVCPVLFVLFCFVFLLCIYLGSVFIYLFGFRFFKKLSKIRIRLDFYIFMFRDRKWINGLNIRFPRWSTKDQPMPLSDLSQLRVE